MNRRSERLVDSGGTTSNKALKLTVRSVTTLALSLVLLSTALLACGGRPTITVSIMTRDSAGAEVPLADAYVEVWSSDGLTWLKSDDQGNAIFEELQRTSSWPPSLDGSAVSSSSIYDVRVQPTVEGAVCPTVYSGPRDFTTSPHHVRITVPRVGLVNVEADGYYASVAGAGWRGGNTINANEVAVCVWANQVFSVSVVDRDGRPIHTWSHLTTNGDSTMTLAFRRPEGA